MKTQTCRSHCAECNHHFAGDMAFEAHRAGTFDPPDRYCLDPQEARHEKSNELIFESVQGECRISDPPETHTCSVWRLAGSSARASAAFRPESVRADTR